MRLASGAERITALAMLAICAGLLIAGYDLRYWDGFAPASGFAPVWIAIAGIVLALLLFFQVGAAAGTDDASHRPDRAELSRVLLTTTALWIFLAITPFTGMLLAALALMLFMLIVVLERPLLASLLTAVFTTLLVYAIFILWLRVRLPRGVFGF